MGHHGELEPEVRVASAILVAVSADGYRLRGKITIRFHVAQFQGVADRAVQAAMKLAKQELAEHHCSGEPLLIDDDVVQRILSTLPSSVPRTRDLTLSQFTVHGIDPERQTRRRKTPLGREALSVETPFQSSLRVTGSGQFRPPSISEFEAQTGALQAVLSNNATEREGRKSTLPPAPPVVRIEDSVIPPASERRRKPLLWVRRRSSWARALAAIPTDTPEQVSDPIMTAVRDGAGRLACAAFLALDHEDYDLLSMLGDEPASPLLKQRIMAEATSCSSYLLHEALLKMGVRAERALGILSRVLDALLPERSQANSTIGAYLAAQQPEVTMGEALARFLPDQRTTDLEMALLDVIDSVRSDMATAGRILYRSSSASMAAQRRAR